MSSATVTPPALTCIQIDLAPLQLAVPIDRVEKVVRPSEVTGTTTTQSGPDDEISSGIVYYADKAVTLLNLQQHLLQTRTAAHYFLVLRATSGELVALPIPQAPNLVEFPPQTVKMLPTTYRRVNLLGIASHVARNAEGQTSFILDVDYLVNRWGVSAET